MTKAEEGKFWEACGLQRLKVIDGNLYWFDKDKNIVSSTDEKGDPILSLDNLFKYAVPKYGDDIDIEFYPLKERCCCSLVIDSKDYRIEGQETYVLALRDALWQVLKRGDEAKDL